MRFSLQRLAWVRSQCVLGMTLSFCDMVINLPHSVVGVVVGVVVGIVGHGFFTC